MVSIVVPSYNQVDFIEETLLSVCTPSSEVIVYDGFSNDRTEALLKKYNSDLAFWASEKDRGQSHAINKGLKKVSGEVFNWINSDDYLESNAISTIQSAFSNASVKVFIGQSNIVQDGNVLRQSRGTDVYWGNLAKTLGQARIDQPEHWWRKSVIDEIGPLNEALHYTMDRDWWIKYLLRYGLKGIKKEKTILANFRLHKDSKTVSQSAEFFTERNNYYFSLALNYGLDDVARVISTNEEVFSIPMTNLPDQVDLDMLSSAFQYFFVLLADEAYVAGDHIKVRRLIRQIDADRLELSDQKLIQKIRFRSNLPPRIIAFLRSFRNGAN